MYLGFGPGGCIYMIWNSRLSPLAGAFLLVMAVAPASAQTPGTPQPKPSKSAAYYHAAMGHLYSELAAQYGGRGEYVGKAIENYKLAMRYDRRRGPGAGVGGAVLGPARSAPPSTNSKRL